MKIPGYLKVVKIFYVLKNYVGGCAYNVANILSGFNVKCDLFVPVVQEFMQI